MSLLLLLSITGLPGKKDIGCDHRDDDKHPVLALEAQNGEGFNKKLHDARLVQAEHMPFAEKNVLFMYYSRGCVFRHPACPDDASLSKSDG